MLKNLVILTGFSVIPMVAPAATVSYSGFTGQHYFEGSNVAGTYSTLSAADRTTDVTLEANGTATTDIRSGFGNAATIGETNGLTADDGFYLTSRVVSRGTCLTSLTSFPCPIGMDSTASYGFTFSVDMDSTLFLDGTWAGGRGLPELDGFLLSIEEVGAVDPVLFEIELDPNVTRSGRIFGALGLTAGQTYSFNFTHNAYALSDIVDGARDADLSRLSIAASVIEANADVAAFDQRYQALIAPVPLPAGGVLLLTGLGGMLMLRRSKSRRARA